MLEIWFCLIYGYVDYLVGLEIGLGWVVLLFQLSWRSWVGDLSGFGNLIGLKICLVWVGSEIHLGLKIHLG